MYTEHQICKQCGQPIWGNYIHALGATWHAEHFVCAACQQPIQGTSFQIHNGAPYHIVCYAQQVAPRCAYCGRPLTGEYLVDHWGQTFCSEHREQFPMCAYCGRIVPPQQREVGSSVVRCPVCRAHAVETEVEARPLFSRLVRWLTAQGLSYNNLRLSLEICDRARLSALLGGNGPGWQSPIGSHDHALGATTSATYTQNNRVVHTEINGIAVLQGLPPTLFQGVTVHELGHVWLIVHGIQLLPDRAEEGFCELLSYLYYQELRTPEAQYYCMCKERNSDPIYGEGFRRVRALSNNLGFPHFLEVLRTTRQLPGR
jgi:hypothetical protein